MQYTDRGDGSKSVLSEKTMLLLSLGFLIVGSVGYISLQRDIWLYFFFAHLGALGVMGLFGSTAGFLARKKHRRYWIAFSFGFFLPIILGIVAVVIFLWGVNGQLYCGGSVSLVVGVVTVIFYLFAKKKTIHQAVQAE